MDHGFVARPCLDEPARLRRAVLARFGQGLVVVFAPGISISADAAAMRRIGLLAVSVPSTPEEMGGPLRLLRELGWVEGRNLYVERRYATSLDALQSLAEELVRAKVEVILANGPNPTRAAMRATATVPIVFLVASDAVGSGLVASLAHPGGNVTGFSTQAPEVTAKLLSLLKEMMPALRTIGMLETSGNPQFRAFRAQFEQSCREVGVEAVFAALTAPGEIDAAVARLARQQAQALMLFPDSFAQAHGPEMIYVALKRGLPTVAPSADAARDFGALASFSVTIDEANEVAARHIDRILRGVKPADLPVEQPKRFRFVVNLKTARTLGVAVPGPLVLRADEVIR